MLIITQLVLIQPRIINAVRQQNENDRIFLLIHVAHDYLSALPQLLDIT
ncbi:MAG: hypothetical protein JSU75_04215 [Gammaproteobacteria bacterium]|nr:MAG: hypothetical protein JSU75_04215 [Gammaproteobacteria bacterium]